MTSWGDYAEMEAWADEPLSPENFEKTENGSVFAFEQPPRLCVRTTNNLLVEPGWRGDVFGSYSWTSA